MHRAWPLLLFYAITVIGLALTPIPPAFRLTPIAAWPAVNVSAQSLSPEQQLLADLKFDINRAGVAELRALPDVGEGLAQRIVAFRSRRSLRCEGELEQLVGAARLAGLRPFLKPLPKRCPLANQGVEFQP